MIGGHIFFVWFFCELSVKFLTIAPPFPPQLSIAASSVSSLTLRLKPSEDVDQSPAAGYTIHHKQEFGDWETVQVRAEQDQ